MTPNALAEHFDTSRQAVSKHLRILTECELLQQHSAAKQDVIVFGCTLIERYVKCAAEKGPDLDEFRVRFLDALLKLYVDERPAVLEAAAAAMSGVVATIPASDEQRYVTGLRAALQSLPDRQRVAALQRQLAVPVGQLDCEAGHVLDARSGGRRSGGCRVRSWFHGGGAAR